MNRAGLLLGAWLVIAAHAIDTHADAQSDARLTSATARCQAAELLACDEALNLHRNDPLLLVDEGDALVRHDRPGEAIGVYKNALTVGAQSEVVLPKIALAQTARRAALNVCTSADGDAADRACESAWLPGAADEVSIFKRRGQLLQAANKPAAALDAYLSAARLRPHDRAVAKAVITLVGSTGRADAAALTALGTAQWAMGRNAESITTLRRALKVAPDDALARERLRAVERAVAASTEAAAAAPAPAAQVAANASNEAEETRSN